jgi:hypothetical protein
MIVMFSARRLKPGAWDQFRRAWDPGDAKPLGFQRAYHHVSGVYEVVDTVDE